MKPKKLSFLCVSFRMRTQKSRFLLEHQADILNNTEGVVMDKQNKPNFLRLP